MSTVGEPYVPEQFMIPGQPVAPVVEPDPDPKPLPPVDRPERKPVHKRGWFWGLIGGILVVGAVTAAVVLTRKPGFEPELGTIGPNSGAVGLRF